MTPGTSFYGLTRVADQLPDVFPGSPTALTAVFCAIVQSRFFQQGGAPPLPWFWSIDPTPREDNEDARRIEIAPATQEHPDARSNYPALLVARDAIQYRSVAGSRTVHEEAPLRAKMVYCHAITRITVQCLSRNDGESATLADLVASHLYASAEDFSAEFGLHDVGEPIVGTTVPYKRLENEVLAWRTDVVIDVTMKYKWFKYPLAPVLREFRLHLTNGSEIRDLRAVQLTRPPPYP